MANTATVVKMSAAKQARLVDELGGLKAQIAALQDQFDKKVQVFKDFGAGDYTGVLFRLNVNDAETTRLDTAKVKSFLTPAQIALASKTTTSTVARLYAR